MQDEFAKFFDAERANLMIVNRNSKEIYRVIFDKEKSELKMKLYGFDKGFAGYVAFSAQTLFVDSVDEDNRYNKEVDDPLGKSKAHQIIAVPIFCSSDRFDNSADSLAQIPRAIISVINKKDPNGFTQRVI